MNNLPKNLHVRALMYAGAVFLVIVSILAITATAFIARGNRSYDENTITVTGTAELSSAPDVATFSFTVKESAKETKEAQDVISKKVATILGGFDELGINEKDIKTESYTMYPRYEWVRVDQQQSEIAVDGTLYFPGQDRKQVQTGFDVSQNVSIKVRDFDLVPDVLTLLGETGVENLYGPNFEVDEPDELELEARSLAINDAKDKAKRLADDLGVKLGKVISFSEGSGYPMPYYAKAELAVASYDTGEDAYQPELPTGENTITANVSVTYKIK